MVRRTLHVDVQRTQYDVEYKPVPVGYCSSGKWQVKSLVQGWILSLDTLSRCQMEKKRDHQLYMAVMISAVSSEWIWGPMIGCSYVRIASDYLSSCIASCCTQFLSMSRYDSLQACLIVVLCLISRRKNHARQLCWGFPSIAMWASCTIGSVWAWS